MSGINEKYYKKNFDFISNDEKSKIQNYKLKTITFEQVVQQNIDIDYLSIDIEGGEMDLLNSIDFNKNNIKVISLENSVPAELNFKNFFENKKFIYFDRIGFDEIFYNSKFFKFE